MMLITASVRADNDVKVLLKTPRHSASKKGMMSQQITEPNHIQMGAGTF